VNTSFVFDVDICFLIGEVLMYLVTQCHHVNMATYCPRYLGKQHMYYYYIRVTLAKPNVRYWLCMQSRRNLNSWHLILSKYTIRNPYLPQWWVKCILELYWPA